MTLAAHYRVYTLPWEDDPREQRRFRLMMLGGLLAVLVFSLLFHRLELPVLDETAEQAVPPRFARLMAEEKPRPPPPKPPELPQPPEPKVPPKPEDTRRKMEQHTSMRAIRDSLAALRDQLDVTPLQQRNLVGQVSADARTERSLIASKLGAGSASNVTANASGGFGSGAGSLAGHDTQAVTSGLGSEAARVTRTGSSGKAARGGEEIELVFDRNKGAIYALYNRALRDNPELKGKLVLELTITPAGDVSDCRLVSSELGDADLERKIVARVRLFRFEARDVAAINVRKTIEFFPQ